MEKNGEKIIGKMVKNTDLTWRGIIMDNCGENEIGNTGIKMELRRFGSWADN